MLRPDILAPPPSTGPVETLARPLTERRIVVAVMACTVLVELALQLLGDEGSVAMGRIPVSLVAAPALVMIAAVGPRQLLGRGTRPYPLGFWVAGLIALTSASIVYARAFDDWVDVGGILLAAFTEEAVYRLAAPVFLAAALVRLGVGPLRARTIGFAGAGVWWVFLPGHVDQMDSAMAVSSFAAAALLFAVVVVRSGSLMAATLVHAVMNLLAFTEWADALGPDDRRLLVAALLGLLVLAFGRPGRRSEQQDELVIDLRGEATVVDLRGAEPRQAERDTAATAHSPIV